MRAKTFPMLMIMLLLCSHISIASLPDCASMSSMQNQMTEMVHEQMTSMEHAHHQMMEQEVADQSTQCCGADCRCPAGISANQAIVSEHGLVSSPIAFNALNDYLKSPLAAHLKEQIKPPTLV